MKKIGCFVTSHGYGHAARMTAVLDSLSSRVPHTPHIFTSVPESIFTQSLTNYRYHYHLTDIGFIQKDAFQIDIDATCSRLSTFVPYSETTINRFVEECKRMSVIVSDISPLGICVAKRLGIPSILVENFTWAWLYNSFTNDFPQMGQFARYFEEQFAQADFHIQTEPLCNPAKVDLHCGPIFRRTKENSTTIKNKFECGQRKVVVVTMGGISFIPSFLGSLKSYNDFFFIFCGQDKDCKVSKNVQLLNRSTDLYHPDLINCADIVVFKSGYSTLAECFQAGNATICVKRDGFAESEIIENYAKQFLHSTLIEQADFVSGKWLELLPDITIKPNGVTRENGADTTADFIAGIVKTR